MLQVFDVTGQLVRTLVKGNIGAGVHELLWDGKDEWGIPMGNTRINP